MIFSLFKKIPEYIEGDIGFEPDADPVRMYVKTIGGTNIWFRTGNIQRLAKNKRAPHTIVMDNTRYEFNATSEQFEALKKALNFDKSHCLPITELKDKS